MAEFDLVVRGGTVATASDVVPCDVGVRAGRIAALGLDLAKGEEEIDAKGLLVLPGGVDGHVHLAQPSNDGSECADDFWSGTVSAACGGTTTVLPFALQQKGRSLREAVTEYHKSADGQAAVDYAFHLIVSDPTEQVLGQELPALVRDGYTSFKVYMTYDDLKLNDRQMLDVLTLARAEGAMVMIHAENADCIGWLTEKLEAAGRTQPKYHAVSRPQVVEREATHRAITLGELADTPFLFVHVSGREAIEQIRWAQGRGLKVYAETCPQYLFLSEDDLDLKGFEGAKCICSPPPRDKANQRYVWEGLVNGTFQVFSSDHAPYRYDSRKGKQLFLPTNPSFRFIPNGIPGIETRLPLLFSEGVMKGRLELTQFVALTSTNPAKIYGLHPRKGTIAVGSDADLAIWDPEKKVIIRNGDLHHNVDYTPYEGREITGWPRHTLSRGRRVWSDGKVEAVKGHGAFLPAALPVPAQPRMGGSYGPQVWA